MIEGQESAGLSSAPPPASSRVRQEPWSWGSLVLVVVLGIALSAVLLVLGGAAYAGPLALVVPVYLVTLLGAGLVTQLEAALLLHGHFTNPQKAIVAGDTQHTVAQFLVLWAAIGLVGPIVEELVFRGMLYQLFRRSLPL